MLWSILWVMLANGNPTKTLRIGYIEKDYLVRSLRHQIDFETVRLHYFYPNVIDRSIHPSINQSIDQSIDNAIGDHRSVCP